MLREFREKCEQDEKDLVAMMLAEIPVATEALEATGHWDPEENAFHWLMPYHHATQMVVKRVARGNYTFSPRQWWTGWWH